MKVVAFVLAVNMGSIKIHNAFWAGKDANMPAPKEKFRYTKDVNVKPDTFPVERGINFKKNIERAYQAKIDNSPVILTIEGTLITNVNGL